jgi:hypothetical protein
MPRGLVGFADDAAMQSGYCIGRGVPVYASLLGGAMASDAARSRLAAAWETREFDAWYERPMLLCAALRQAAMTRPGHPLAPQLGESADGTGSVDPRLVEEALQEEAVFHVLRQRFVQTNEVARAVAWRLALSTWPGPPGARVHLVDLGCSAGLNLIGDRLDQLWHDEGGRAVRVDSQAVIASRTGFDRYPLDVRVDEDASWLRASVWPGQADRLHRLDAALAAARASSVKMVTCSAQEMPAHLERIALEHPGDFVLAYSTVFIEYVRPEERTAFAAGMRSWLTRFVGQSVWVELEAGTGEITPDLPAEIRATLCRGGSTARGEEAALELSTVRLARCDYHSTALGDVMRL